MSAPDKPTTNGHYWVKRLGCWTVAERVGDVFWLSGCADEHTADEFSEIQSDPIERLTQATVAAACGCYNCLSHQIDPASGLPLTAVRMALCSTCGNKRCPKGTNHNNACTGSNAEGQPGSLYANSVVAVALEAKT